ncbi:MAG: LemA family protein [Planctomycetota bacterium]
MGIAVALVLGVLVGLVALFVATYNRLVTQRNRYKNAYAQIDVQLKRRFDLIPNLVDTAKGYLTHEKELFERVTQARAESMKANRAAALDPGAAPVMMALMASETALLGAMGGLLGVVENYPELKGDQTMKTLMEELRSTENRVAFARQAYNDFIMRFNNACETFPGLVVAGPLGFSSATYFRVDESERGPVTVSLS